MRRDVERDAFAGLVGELEQTWQMVLREHDHPAGTTSADIYRTVPDVPASR